MVAPTCFSITLPSSGSIPSAFWEMLNWGAVDRILWMGVLYLVMWCACIGVFVGFSCIFLPGILIFKGLTACRLYKSFSIKRLIHGHGKYKVSKFGTLLIWNHKKFKILATDNIHILLLQQCLQSSIHYITKKTDMPNQHFRCPNKWS
jgi:hypothetical protein